MKILYINTPCCMLMNDVCQLNINLTVIARAPFWGKTIIIIIIIILALFFIFKKKKWRNNGNVKS